MFALETAQWQGSYVKSVPLIVVVTDNTPGSFAWGFVVVNLRETRGLVTSKFYRSKLIICS